MPKIIPIRELQNTSEISKMCHTTDEPIFVTKNEYGDMVIMSIQAYEEKMMMTELFAKLDEAEQQIKEGKTTDARQSLKQLRERYGI